MRETNGASAYCHCGLGAAEARPTDLRRIAALSQKSSVGTHGGWESGAACPARPTTVCVTYAMPGTVNLRQATDALAALEEELRLHSLVGDTANVQIEAVNHGIQQCLPAKHGGQEPEAPSPMNTGITR